MDIKKTSKTVAENVRGTALGVVFIAAAAVNSIPVAISHANQAVTNKIFG
jgi:hypothetical protein